MFGSACLLLGSLLGAASSAGGEAVAPPVRALPDPGQRQTFAPGEVHRYRLELAAGEGRHVRIDKHGIDVMVAVEEAGVATPRTFHAPGGPEGRHDVVLEAARATAYTLMLTSRLRRVPVGSYGIRVAPLAASDAPAAVLRAMSDAGAEDTDVAEGQRRARDHYLRALGLLPVGSQQPLRAIAWFRAALLARRLNDQEQALAGYRSALALNLALGDLASEARTRNGMGLSLRASNRIAEARAEFERAAAVAERARDGYEAASALNNICLTDLHFGRMAEARSCLERAVARYRSERLGEHASVPLINLAATYDYLGLPDLARARYAEALELRRGGIERLPLAQVLTNLAVLDKNTGDYAVALAEAEEALAIIRTLGERGAEARALRIQGSILQAAGLPARAQVYFEQALPITEALKDRRAQADTLAALGEVGADAAESERRHRDALTLYEAAGDAHSSARERLALARLARRRGDAAEAERLLARAGEAADRSGARAVRFAIAVERARGALARADGAGAEASLRAADALVGKPAAGDDLLQIADLRVSALVQGGRHAEAQAVAERALRASIDARGSGLTPELRERERLARATLLASWIDIVAASGDAERTARAGAVLGLIEDLRAAEFAAWLAYGRRERDPAHDTLQRTLVHRRAQLDAAARQGTEPARLAELERALEAALAELDRAERRGSARAPASGRANADVLRSRLRVDSAALVYAFGHARGLRATLRRDAVRLDVIEHAPRVRALAARTDVRRDAPLGGDDAHAGPELGTALLSGVQLDGVRRVYLSLDPALQGVPFEPLVLDDGRAFARLAASVALPSLASLDDSGPTLREATVAVFADADYGDAAAPDGTARGAELVLPRLPASAREAQRIEQRFGAARVRSWLRERATAAALLQSGDHGILHVATHAVADPARMDASALMLSVDPAAPAAGPTLVGVRDILRSGPRAQLVVLSGCETAQGRTSAGGASFGLSEAFLGRGARFVLSAQRPVDDIASATYMDRYYEHLAASGDPVEAHRAVAVDALDGTLRLRTESWAAFRLSASGPLQAK